MVWIKKTPTEVGVGYRTRGLDKIVHLATRERLNKLDKVLE